MKHFILRKDNTFKFYTSTKRLCEGEKLNKSKSYFYKHFSDQNYYEDDDVQIWRNRK